MKVEKNKIVFAAVLVVIFIFLISYSMMVMGDDENENDNCDDSSNCFTCVLGIASLWRRPN